jgi:protein TonB
MWLKNIFLVRRFPVPIVISVSLHLALIATLLYASMNEVLMLPQQEPAANGVMMVNMAALSKPAPPAAEPEPPPEPVAEPVPVAPSPPEPETPKPKAKLKPQPKIEKPLPREVNAAAPTEPPPPESHTQTLPSSSAAAQPAPDLPAMGAASQLAPQALYLAKPVYPPRALALYIEGKVVVQFDVDSAGRVINARILFAEPRNLFEREVKQAMRQWRYQPRAAQNLQKTIIFKTDGSTWFD